MSLHFLSALNPRHSIRARLVWVIGLLGSVLALLMSLLVGEQSTQQVRADKGALMAELAQQMAGEMDRGVFERLREVQNIAALELMREQGAAVEQKRALLQQVKSTYEYYAWIGVTDAQGNIIAGTDGLLEGKNVGKRDWFVEGSKGPHVGDVHDAFLLAKILPKPKYDFLPLRLLDVSAPVRDAEGRLVGVICGHLSWDWSFQVRNTLLEPLKSHSNTDVLVLNREGSILLGTPELLGLTQTLELPSTQQARLGESGFLVETWPDGGSYLTGYAPSRGHMGYAGLGWMVLVRQSAAEAFAEAAQLRLETFATGMGFAVMFALLLWTVVGRLTRPTLAIASAAEQIHGGEQSMNIPLYEGTDEAARLSASLHSMVQRLRSSDEQMRLAAQVFRASTEGIIITDAAENILSVNQAFCDITGYSAEEVIGRRPSVLNSGRQGAEFYTAMWHMIQERGKWQGEIWNRRKNGEIYPEWLIVTTVRNDQGAITHFIGIFTDITERKWAEARIEHMAHHDSLTDLPNRAFYFDRLSEALLTAQRNGAQVAVLFIDLDRFKNINDTLGHDVGDRMLVEVAQRLVGCVDDVNNIARMGGDEFVILQPQVQGSDAAVQLAQRIITALTKVYTLDNGYQLNITASIGISLYPENAADVMTLTRQADTAMFHAKSSGRDNYKFFNDAMNTEIQERMRLEHGLRNALQEEEFSLQFQPQYALADGSVVGFEALLRWHSREMGQVSPARFIPVAEETGQIHAIGAWVLRTACQQFMRWQAKRTSSAPLRLAVNLSVVQFQDDELPQMIRAVLEEAGMPGSMLELEITESVLMGNEHMVEQHIDRFHQMGIRVVIDDFGVGYSSLHYLKHLNIDGVKIDRSFVQEMHTDPDVVAIVEAVIAMAHSLHLPVVAEGIETQEQYDFLKARGCDAVQGFLLSRPLPAEACAQVLRAGEV